MVQPQYAAPAPQVVPQYAPPPPPQYGQAPQYGAAQPLPQYPLAQPPQYGAAPAPQYGAAPGASPFAPQPQATPQFGPGARVLVQWADGNRYPAMVQQSAGAQCLVVFPNGQQQWVDAQYLSFG